MNQIAVEFNQKDFKIALLLNREYVFGRSIMQGVMSYVRPAKTWRISIGRLTLKDVRKIISFKPDGIIAEVYDEKVASILGESQIPFVDVSDVVPGLAASSVCADNFKVGQMAALHFLERGFVNFAYIGGKNKFAELREEGFAKTLAGCDMPYLRFTKKINLDFYGSNILGETSGGLHKWLEELPKPIAIFACNDGFSLIVNETCRNLDIHVPDRVAILGVDNDEQFCQLETPALSSVELPLRQIGIEAVKTLEGRMLGETSSIISKRLPPMGIVKRQSTDIVAFKDEVLSEAMRYIRENADRPIAVEDVCDELCVSRRLLEKKMKEHIGHSPLSEIHRVHIERAKYLLIQGNLTLSQIALSSGFRSPERMSVLFKRFTGTTPSKFRKQYMKRA